ASRNMGGSKLVRSPKTAQMAPRGLWCADAGDLRPSAETGSPEAKQRPWRCVNSDSFAEVWSKGQIASLALRRPDGPRKEGLAANLATSAGDHVGTACLGRHGGPLLPDQGGSGAAVASTVPRSCGLGPK